jgi:hypothetical protein
VVSRESFADLEFSVQVTTLDRLRAIKPNPWEIGWVRWSYLDDTHFYYLALKPNGWELGKEDPAYPGNQRFLATGESPVFPIGRTADVTIRQRGDAVQAFADGRLLGRVRNTERPYRRGAVGLRRRRARPVRGAAAAVLSARYSESGLTKA